MSAGSLIDPTQQDAPPQAQQDSSQDQSIGIPVPQANFAADSQQTPQAQQPSIDQSSKGPNGKGTVPTPTVQPQYDPEKLKKANTTLDILNAMKPKSRNEYMNWWEQQHGSINDKYDALQNQLGKRPADEQAYSKKEKFAFLLQFGLALMKNSANATNTGQTQASALNSTLADSVNQSQQQHQAGINQQQQDYDQKSNAIEQARQKDLAGLGTPAQAMAEQSKIDQSNAAQLKDTAGAYKDVATADQTKAASLGAPTYATDKDGGLVSLVRQPDGTTKATPVTGIDGKPFSGRVIGRSAGSGVEKGDTTQEKNYKFLSGLGVDNDTAMTIAFKAKTGNPTADKLSVYRTVMSATYGDADKAKQAADEWVKDNYGPQNSNGPTIPNSPSSYNFQGLKAGQMRTMPDGSHWTVGIDGKPHRVTLPGNSGAIP